MAFAQNATVTGTVTDGDFKDFLVGAVVSVEGTTKGAVADVNGRYSLPLPAGNYTIVFSFLGYTSQTFDVQLQAGEVRVIDAEMHSESDVLEGVVVSAQAKGQQAAINSQLRASGIINAVSVEKLSELPDVNVADAIGRLPGLMIQRDGGEGQKIIIRGLSPKYNTVAINGMNAPATGETDRSTDLNMLSPDMIAGAEVMKANTADKDADGLGGTVNLIMKDAPSGPRLSVQGETGYHSLINGIGRYKAGINGSNRFFNDKFGVIMGATFDQTDRSNDTFGTNFEVSGNTPTPGLSYTQPWIKDVSLQSNLEKRTRINGTVNFDLDLGNGNRIKLFNVVSTLGRDRDVRKNRYSFDKNKLRYTQAEINSSTTNLSNVLQGEFNILGSTLNVGAGHSAAWMKTPMNRGMDFYLNEPYSVAISSLEYLAPDEAISKDHLNPIRMSDFYLYETEINKTRTFERELSAWVDWKLPFEFGKAVSGYVKLGGKYRQKNRSYETENYSSRFDLTNVYTKAYENMPDVTRPTGNGGNGVAILDFLDNSYKGGQAFLNNRYPGNSFDFALDPSYMNYFCDKQSNMFKRKWSDMVERDYEGLEQVYAGYVMTELNFFGDLITFIPGVRYDFTYLQYKGYSGENITDDHAYELPFEITKNTDSEKFGYWLPQIHLKIKPVEWADLRLAYTKTLSRPDFNNLAPRTIIRPASNSIIWSRTNLKPILSTNYDVTLSIYPTNWGLFTVSAFYKDIENFIYRRTANVLAGTATDPSVFDLHSSYAGYTISYPLNSPTRAAIVGLEFDAQLQMHHLNNFLKGFVLNANFTLMDSGMDYRASNITRKRVDGKLVSLYKDVEYNDRLINQPSYLFNVSLGYDYKKFSGRVSCNYQDGVLKTAQQRPDGADKVETAPFMKWDAQFKYSLNKRLAFYLNFSNFNFAMDETRRTVTGYPQEIEFYGSTIYLGIKYDIIK